MAKRKLTRQQQHRVNKIQQEKAKRASKREAKAEEALASGDLGEETRGTVVCHFGVMTEIEATDGQRFRCHKRANLPALVTGDEIVWRPGADNTGVVVAQQPRHSELMRPDTRGQLKPIAANVDQVIVVVSPSPETPLNLLDRYLVAVHAQQLKPVILLNKCDLLEPHHPFSQEVSFYRQLGYQVIEVSAKQESGLSGLTDAMANQCSVLVGQSGVGKSSLTNQLVPEANIRTTEVSLATGKGQHTTTTAELFHLPNGGTLIDSPGIREFGLWHIDEDQLLAGFLELAEQLEQRPCKFRNCRHSQEPGCGLKLALADEAITQRRFDSYIAIRDSLSEVAMRPNE